MPHVTFDCQHYKSKKVVSSKCSSPKCPSIKPCKSYSNKCYGNFMIELTLGHQQIARCPWHRQHILFLVAGQILRVPEMGWLWIRKKVQLDQIRLSPFILEHWYLDCSRMNTSCWFLLWNILQQCPGSTLSSWKGSSEFSVTLAPEKFQNGINATNAKQTHKKLFYLWMEHEKLIQNG